MEIVFLIAGLLVGAVASYLIARTRSVAAQALLEAEQKARADERQQHEAQLDALKREHKEQLEQCKREADEQLALRKREADEQLSQRKREADEQRAKELAELRRSYEQQLALFKAEVQTWADRLLKERSGELQQANTQRMDELLRPLKENIVRMEQSMSAGRVAAAESQARFEEAVGQMMKTGERLVGEADRLSTALQRKNKLAGNWGELILTELLESQGLKAGIHFDVQQTMKDETGRTLYNEETGSRMIPDVVMHLGDGREVVVDSKMSLTAFVDYQNADDEASRQEALGRHIESVRTHIKELSSKDYSSYVAGARTAGIDFVIMFVPIEGALLLAQHEDPTLWREAFDKKVFLASGQTLTAALHIIRLTWVAIQQERNTQKIMDEARKLIDRVAAFYKEFQAVGQKLSDAAKAYAAVEKRVDQGGQSILSTGHRLEDLGARGKKELPRPEAITGGQEESI